MNRREETGRKRHTIAGEALCRVDIPGVSGFVFSVPKMTLRKVSTMHGDVLCYWSCFHGVAALG